MKVLTKRCIGLLSRLEQLEQEMNQVRSELQLLSCEVDESEELHFILKYDAQDESAQHIRQLIEESYGTVH